MNESQELHIMNIPKKPQLRIYWSSVLNRLSILAPGLYSERLKELKPARFFAGQGPQQGHCISPLLCPPPSALGSQGTIRAQGSTRRLSLPVLIGEVLPIPDPPLLDVFQRGAGGQSWGWDVGHWGAGVTSIHRSGSAQASQCFLSPHMA